MIKFSICIPNYNYSNYIVETIESVLNQTYPNFEIVIVDNASTDNSWEVIQSYVKKDSRVTAHRNNYNVGFAPNLDRAASKANNEFIIMLSSDDTMKQNALEVYNSILAKIGAKNSQNLLLCSAADVIDSQSVFVETLSKNRFHNIKPEGQYANLFKDSNISDYKGLLLMKNIFPRFSVPGPFNTTLYSKVLYEKVGGYSSINLIGPDGHFAYKCLFSEADVIFYDKPLFNYRVHNKGQLNLSSKNKNINILVDRYIFSNAYSDAQLKSAGLNRMDFQKATLERDCLKGALKALNSGEWTYALRHYLFGFSAYFNVAFKCPLTYYLFLLLLLGPFGILLVKAIFAIRGTNN